jgi:hypothetical protein
MNFNKTTCRINFGLIAILYLSTSIASPRMENVILTSDILVNSTNEELIGKRLIVKDFNFNIIVSKKVNSTHTEYELFPSLKKEYVSIGLFDETSLALKVKTSKIYFTNFDLGSDTSYAGNIETNGIYEFDYVTKKLKKLTSEKDGEISFYRISKLEGNDLYYQKVMVKKDDVMMKSQHLYTGRYDTYFHDLYQKLVNEKSLEKMKID